MISYVELFRPQAQDAVGQILSGGTNVLTGALNNAIQIGRDSVNLRGSQERDYLAERERVENLNQRRVEFITNQKNTDRSFFENVFRDRRDTEEANMDDERDFDFKVETTDRELDMRAADLESLIGSRDSSSALAERKFQLDVDEREEDRTFLKTRAADILKKSEPKSFIERLFGNDDIPEDDISRGNELKSIGATLGDPTIVSRGDALITKGTKGVLTRREDQRYVPGGRSRSGKQPATLEEQIAELEMEVQAREEELTQLEADGEDPRLSQAQSINLRKYKIKLNQLKEKAGQPTEKTEEATSIVDHIKNKYLRK